LTISTVTAISQNAKVISITGRDVRMLSMDDASPDPQEHDFMHLDEVVRQQLCKPIIQG
jgi:hypothetical protein